MTGGDEAAIGAIVAAQMAAWNRGDAEGYALNAGDDLSFTNIRGQRWIGRAGFVTAHERLFKGIFAGSRLEAEIEGVSFPGTGVVVAEALLTLRGAQRLPPGIVGEADGSLRVRLMEVFEHREGEWVLVAYHNTAVLG